MIKLRNIFIISVFCLYAKASLRNPQFTFQHKYVYTRLVIGLPTQ